MLRVNAGMRAGVLYVCITPTIFLPGIVFGQLQSTPRWEDLGGGGVIWQNLRNFRANF